MKEYLVDAIILRSVKTKEADRVLTLYTKQLGKKRAMAYGVDKPTSRKRGAVQPFSYSRLMLRRGRELDSVSQGEGMDLFPSLRQSLEGLAAANYLSELVDAFSPDEDPNPAIFDLLLETFALLGGKEASIAVWAFEMKLIALLGYQPGLDQCVCCGSPLQGDKVCFLPEQGGVVCVPCRNPAGTDLQIHRGTLQTLKALLGWETDRIGCLRIDRACGQEVKRVIRGFIQYHLEKNIKSSKFIDFLNGYE